MAYIVLALIGVGLAVWSAAGERKAVVTATLIVATAAILMADWIAFGWFRLYSYHPHLAANPLVDEVLGEVLSEAVFVPGLVVFLSRFLPGLTGSITGAVIVTGIELVFLWAGLLGHHGWTTLHTVFGFAIYFLASHRFWCALRSRGLTSEPLAKLLRFSAVFVTVSLLTLFLRALGFVETNITVLPTYLGNQSLGRFITYGLVTVPLGYWVASTGGAHRWLRLAAVVAGLLGFNIGLTATGFQFFLPPWSLWMDAVAQGVAIAIGVLILDAIQALAENECHQRTRT